MKTFICSDLHLGHLNILKYEPIRIEAIWDTFKCFQTHSKIEFKQFVLKLFEENSDEAKAELIDILKYHDKMIINNFNAVVSDNDIVWILGDIALADGQKFKRYMAKLNGIKKLIKGNHDRKTNNFYLESGFNFVSNYPILIHKKFILSHAPLDIQENSIFVNIFGHVHSSPYVASKTNSSFCVCLERLEFKPILLDSIIKEF